MIRLALAYALLAGCVTSNATVCSDGRLCPAHTACDDAHHLCVEPEQLSACAGMPDTTACNTIDVNGLCQDGVCLATVCGDGIVELGEMCDDGNTSDGDGCSQTCTSDETCGNHVVDVVTGEACDDGNHVDHDGCTSTCVTETPHWVEHSLAPPARTTPALAYDARRERAVMFGGLSGSTIYQDTWLWNGGEWLRPPLGTAPAVRLAAGFAYDADLGKSFMFGGSIAFVIFEDMWSWDGARWEPVQIAVPPGRGGQVMVYDGKRKRIVMFGGLGNAAPNPGTIVLNDTWEFDGVKWDQITPAHSPPKRLLAAAAYDPHRGVVVMTGGWDSASTYYADTWEYDGVDWHDVTPASGTKPQVAEGVMGYDAINQRVLLYGGRNSGAVSSVTWGWNGTAWSNVLSGTPAGRTAAGMAQTRDGLVMFGGSLTSGGSPLNETWQWTGSTWQQAKDPGPRNAFAMFDDPKRARGLVYGGFIDAATRVGDTWELARQWTLRAGPPPNARGAPCVGYDRMRDEYVMFGGTPPAGGELAETWVWNGSGWAQRTPATSPGARKAAACAWDGREVVLVGGTVGSTPQADAWKWDGTTWTKLTDYPAAAGPHGDAAAGYDPIRNQLVVFGGIGNLTVTDTTIIYDGTTWQVPPLDFRPPPRTGATLTWNPARETLVLAGGLGGGLDMMDSYEWDGSHWHVIPAVAAPVGRYDHGAMTSIDGGGVTIYGGTNPFTGAVLGDRWELRWDADVTSDRCDATDLDRDGLARCQDPDCWRVCAPLCPPGTTCVPGGQTCGDHVCNAGPENCRTCPDDCGACTAVCGDGICDPGETGCPGDCP